MGSTTTKHGTLWLIPVGLDDEAPIDCTIPAYNIEVIKGLRHFVVENVRTARRFLRRCDREFPIDDSAFEVLDVKTRPEAVDALLQPLLDGHDVGLMSEAGCPAVADPGAALVAVAQKKGIKVVPLVGPSSILMSLMASGFNGQSFAFVGYLPIDKHERTTVLKRMLADIDHRHQTQIFIETPYRNNRLVEDLCSTLPSDLRLCIASSITGPGEKIITRPLSQWAKQLLQLDKKPAIFLLNH